MRTVVRAVMVALVAALLTSGEAAAARPVPVGAGAAASQPPSSEEDAAMAQAKASGSRVEVVGSRAETRQLFAEPDGTFTMELSAPPARARKTTASWTPVDTTLRRRPDGRLEPSAAPGTLTLSGGGSNPLIQLGDRDKRVELSWPDRLPAPTLSGDTATYAEVIPGVDLKVTAGAQGFSEQLVVKSRQAASDPRLATLRFGLKTTGLTAAADPQGGMSVKDAAGAVVFASPGAGMWDTPPPPPPAANADDIVETQEQGDHQAQGTVALSSGTVTVTPDQSLLNDPDAIYPISIDPDFQAPGAGWTKVFSGYPRNAYWFGGGDDGFAKVGYCGWSGCGSPTIAATRSFFQFDISALRGAQILDGTELNVHESRSPSCSPTTFEVYQTDPVGPWTTWNNQPGNWAGIASRNAAHGYNGACPPASEGFDVKQSVVNRLGAGSTVATFALKGTGWWDTGGERDKFQWKKFDSGTLIVRYNWPPNAPSPVWNNVDQGPSLGCAVQPNEPYAYSPTPTLHAVLTDPDGQNVQANFQWFVRFGSEVGETSTAFLPSGSPFAVTVPAGAFKDRDRIAWRVRGGDGITWGPWSRWCDITVDSTPPGVLAQVSSADYPYGSHSSGYVGRTGAFSVTSNDPDVIGFQWSLNNSSLPPVDVTSPFFVPVTLRDAATGQVGATIRATPLLEGPNSLYVRAVDRALNVSPAWDKPDGHGGTIRGGYTFIVGSAVPDPVGYWPLDGSMSRTGAPDVTGRGHDGTVTGLWPATGAAWAVGRVGDALRLDGATGQMTTGGPVVNTANTYTVAAWVNLGAADGGWRVAVSQDGPHSSGFVLEYRPDSQKWMFGIASADSDAPGWIAANSSGSAQAGVWTHLLGSFDAGSRQLRLYVNGALSGTAQVPQGTTIPSVAGGMVVGRGKQAGNCCYWLGSVDEVKVWDRLLADSEIQREANGSLVEEAFYPLDEGSGTTAADGSGSYRTGTLGSGVSWVPGVAGAGAVQLNGTNGAITAAQPAVRTDGSFTVTARAYLNAANGAFQTVVAQDGPQSSGFALQYDPGSHAWMLAVSPQDAANPVWLVVRATSAVTTPQQWTHLAGVYDAARSELRLYVDGTEFKASGHVTANVSGGVTIGRARQNGAAVAFFGGRVDDVHLYTGVMAKPDVDNDHLNPVLARPNFHAGELERYFDNNGSHFTTSGLVPHAQHVEGSLGLLAPAGAPNTRTIYSCMYGSGQFVSLQADCEGYTMLGTIGLLYTTPPSGVPTKAIYRCLVPASGDHFDSVDVNCEGWRNEGLQGYTREYRNLVRSVREYLPSGPRDSLASTYPIVSGPGYREESLLGVVATTSEANAWGLESCAATVTTAARGRGTDEFLSHDPACESPSAQALGWIGNTWNDPAPYAQESALLYACRADDTGDRFASLDEFCEGQTVLGSFGYVITRF